MRNAQPPEMHGNVLMQQIKVHGDRREEAGHRIPEEHPQRLKTERQSKEHAAQNHGEHRPPDHLSALNGRIVRTFCLDTQNPQEQPEREENQRRCSCSQHPFLLHIHALHPFSQMHIPETAGHAQRIDIQKRQRLIDHHGILCHGPQTPSAEIGGRRCHAEPDSPRPFLRKPAEQRNQEIQLHFNRYGPA